VHRTYSPFGVEHASAGPASWLPRHYAGHLEDEDSGLVYMQARWMDARSGTFLSVDPVVADAADPQAFNAYAYARNNPLSFSDPTGQFWAELGWSSLFSGFDVGLVAGVHALERPPGPPEGGQGFWPKAWPSLPIGNPVLTTFSAAGSPPQSGEQFAGPVAPPPIKDPAGLYGSDRYGRALEGVRGAFENYNEQRAISRAREQIQRRRIEAEQSREFGDDDAWVWRIFIYDVDPNTGLRSFKRWWVSAPVRVPERTPRERVPRAPEIFDPGSDVRREQFQIYCGWCR
jgi:RHS repeat-associated protein